MYTTVSTMKMNACSVMIRMWKIAQPAPIRNWPSKRPCCRLHVKKLAPSSAISMNTSSPAYMLPNSRIASDTGFDSSSTRFSRKFGIHSSGCAPNGAVKSSWTYPPTPLALTL